MTKSDVNLLTSRTRDCYSLNFVMNEVGRARAKPEVDTMACLHPVGEPWTCSTLTSFIALFTV